MASGCVMVFVGAILLVATTLASECVLVFVGFVGTNPFALLVLAAFGAPVPITTVVFVNIVRIGGWFVKPNLVLVDAAGHLCVCKEAFCCW